MNDLRLAAINAQISDRRRKDASRTYNSFVRFCGLYGVPANTASLPLYLTFLVDEGCDARRLRRDLASLDLSAKIRGEQAWSAHSETKRWIRGIHRELPIGASQVRSDPLYEELVSIVCATVLLPTMAQRVGVAAVLLANATQHSVPVLARLRWQDLRFHHDCVEIRPGPRTNRGNHEIDPHTDGPASLVSALRALRRHRDELGELVFGGKGGTYDEARLRVALCGLPPPQPGGLPRPMATRLRLEKAVESVLAPSPQQVRDRAIMAVAFGAALGTNEAIRIRQRDIVADSRGLVVYVGDRREPVRIGPAHYGASCATSAWLEWRKVLDLQGRLSSDRSAFLQVSGSRVWNIPMSPAGVNYLVHQRCAQADLVGAYAFTSLRSGSIRTAIREDQALHVVAAHAGLTSLGSVARHERRERVISHSIAGRVGL